MISMIIFSIQQSLQTIIKQVDFHIKHATNTKKIVVVLMNIEFVTTIIVVVIVVKPYTH